MENASQQVWNGTPIPKRDTRLESVVKAMFPNFQYMNLYCIFESEVDDFVSNLLQVKKMTRAYVNIEPLKDIDMKKNTDKSTERRSHIYFLLSVSISENN